MENDEMTKYISQSLMEIYDALDNGKDLTDEQESLILKYKNDEDFKNLPFAVQGFYLDVLSLYETKEMTFSKENKQKKLTLNKEDGFAYTLFVAMISGLATSIFVFMFFKSLV